MLIRCRGLLRSPVCRLSVRTVYSVTGVFKPNLEADTLKDIEQHWKPRLADLLPAEDPAKPKYYVLSMFPYPSGTLHLGHVRVYSLSDSLAHYHRLRGYSVLHPMGWDSFGLPAENAARDRGLSPQQWTQDNIEKMREQLLDLGCSFQWEREVSTCEPEYYRWTQHLFLLLYKEGLAYQAEAMVNWDPVDQTVLAEEQVDADGRSWRSGAIVEKKPLRQWFLKTTALAKSLYDGLDDPSLTNWRDIVAAQRNWIGKCSGTNIKFKINMEDKTENLTVWTDQPEFLEGAELLVVHPEHLLPTLHCPQTTGLSGMTAINPLTGAQLPVYVSREAEFPHECHTFLVVPGSCEEHRAVASRLGYSCQQEQGSLLEAGEGEQVMSYSSQLLGGLTVTQARERVMARGRKEGWGGESNSSHLKDWLISRQRYWGTPIPVVHCGECGTVPLPPSHLPVNLPQESERPLAECQDWAKTTCPQCGGPAVRETDTMDTFVDSSWYFLRYLDPHNKEQPFSPAAVENMPVDLYIGGKEHAYLHLFFARFFCHFLHGQGLLPHPEPFFSLLTQGMVKGRTFRLKRSTQYVAPHQVSKVPGSQPEEFVETESGAPVSVSWEKMSKSKHNGVSPAELVAEYGCDTLRLMMLSNVGPSSERLWSEDCYPGVRNMSIKVWKLVHQAVQLPAMESLPELRYDTEMDEYRAKLSKERGVHLRHVNHNYSYTRNLAVVIARLNSLINAAWGVPGQVKQQAPEFQQIIGDILIILAPMAPHLATELWECFRTVPNRLTDSFDFDKNIWHQKWPELYQTDNMELRILANNKQVSKIPIVKWYFDTLTEEQAFDLACHDSKVQDKVLPFNIAKKTFSKQEDFEAVLNIDYLYEAPVERGEVSEEEYQRRKLERKEAEKQRKQLKKQQREERKRLYEENLAKKEKIIKTHPKYPNKQKNS